jgi:hypothetical protein
VSEPLLFSCSSAFAHPAQLKNESVDDFP